MSDFFGHSPGDDGPDDDWNADEDGEDFGGILRPAPVAAAETPKSPRETERLLGHGEIERQLYELIDAGTLPHALIFAGPKGSGKSVMAFRLARFLLAQGRKEATGKEQATGGLFGETMFGEAEGKAPEAMDQAGSAPHSLEIAADDPVFRQVASGGHPDLLAIGGALQEDGAKTGAEGGVAEARKVTPFLRMTASQGGWRVVIIDDADRLTRSAQNAILKILEEPPRRTLLVLIAHRTGALLPTIRSRSRLMRFSPLSEADFGAIVSAADPLLTAHDLALLYGITRGSAGEALSLADNGELFAAKAVMEMMQEWSGDWDWPKIHALVNGMDKSGGGFHVFENTVTWIVESILIHKAGRPLPLPLQQEGVKSLAARYDLMEWSEKVTNLRNFYMTVNQSNLDKRHGVLGTFSTLEAA